MLRSPCLTTLVAFTALCATVGAHAATDADPAATEPRVRRTVIEDKDTRIEEVNERGAVRSIRVQPKGAAAYEVVNPHSGGDAAEGPSHNRGAAGRRVWNLLSF